MISEIRYRNVSPCNAFLLCFSGFIFSVAVQTLSVSTQTHFSGQSTQWFKQHLRYTDIFTEQRHHCPLQINKLAWGHCGPTHSCTVSHLWYLTCCAFSSDCMFYVTVISTFFPFFLLTRAYAAVVHLKCSSSIVTPIQHRVSVDRLFSQNHKYDVEKKHKHKKKQNRKDLRDMHERTNLLLNNVKRSICDAEPAWPKAMDLSLV